jgi:hypothetical protein
MSKRVGKYEIVINGKGTRGAWSSLQSSAQLAADNGHTVTLRRVIFEDDESPAARRQQREIAT